MPRDPHRTYVHLLAGLLVAGMLPLVGLGLWLEPLSGDLTRLGWYAERNFGWRLPQEYFARSLSTLGRYDRYYDVVVVGDSYSMQIGQSPEAPTNYWHNYLAEHTGLSVLVLHFDELSILDVIKTPMFASAPPRLLVYEGVERYLDHGLAKVRSLGADCLSKNEAAAEIAFPGGYDARKITITRPTADWNVNPGYARRYVLHAAARAWFGLESSMVKRLRLLKPGPFSSEENESLLIYKDDLRKAEWPPDALSRIRCQLVELQNIVEANGRTNLLLMFVPDKLTAYSSYVLDEQYGRLSQLHRFLDTHNLPAPRLDIALTRAIDRGVVDVYLPDDTHWGTAGNRIAAETVVAYLMTASKHGIKTPSTSTPPNVK